MTDGELAYGYAYPKEGPRLVGYDTEASFYALGESLFDFLWNRLEESGGKDRDDDDDDDDDDDRERDTKIGKKGPEGARQGARGCVGTSEDCLGKTKAGKTLEKALNDAP